MSFLRGLIVRVFLGALPLLVVIVLCCLMMGWPGRNQQPGILPAQPELTAQAAVVPPTERLILPTGAQNNDAPVLAGFQLQHIEHAHLHVPN